MRRLILLSLLALPLPASAQDWSQLQRRDEEPQHPSLTAILQEIPSEYLSRLPEFENRQLCSSQPVLPDSVAIVTHGTFLIQTWRPSYSGGYGWGSVVGDAHGDTVRAKVGAATCGLDGQVLFEKGGAVFGIPVQALPGLPSAYSSAVHWDKTSEEIRSDDAEDPFSRLRPGVLEDFDVFIIRQGGELDPAFWDGLSRSREPRGLKSLPDYLEERDAGILEQRAERARRSRGEGPSWWELFADVPQSHLGRLPEPVPVDFCSDSRSLPDSVALVAYEQIRVATWEPSYRGGASWGVTYTDPGRDTIRVAVRGVRCQGVTDVLFEEDGAVFAISELDFRELPLAYMTDSDKTSDEIDDDPFQQRLAEITGQPSVDVFLVREDGDLDLAYWDGGLRSSGDGGFKSLDAYRASRDAQILRQRAEREARIRGRGWSRRITDLVVEGRITVGMTADMVTEAWGSPREVNRTITLGGTREQWVYSTSRYVYLEDGVVTAIQSSN